ncbi:hypothetical protein CGCS363_v000187 [Colletotrichum siamense]|uniref:uncharacterized protein n=1 Tax=Colletotrichum siamense TaxID=690259 RepID=UPI001872901B|nr:uncharacterized protein CGCS363_v000187 [Colletotrichum siamense]KAF5515568.1 hypothetical protein CGCS363_v000187 [Colletotrichum siamense]
MDYIYSQADTVAIFLGPQSEIDSSKVAFEFMKSVSDWSRTNTLDSKFIRDQKRMSSVVRLFERSYWKRLWVMQEVFHAKRADVYCGSDYMPLDTIFSACEAFKSLSDDIERYFPAGKVIRTSENHYSYAQTLTTQGPTTLLSPFTLLRHEALEVLRICRSKLAARPQDKILGVLSLLPQDVRSMFQPNFHLTTQEVFTEIVVCIIKCSRTLDVICESIRYPFHQNSFGLPSWVPDWSHSPDTLSLAATHLSHRRPFRACPAEIKLELSVKPPVFSGGELRVSGIQIGTITARGMAVGTLGRLSDYLMAFLEWRHLLHDYEHDRESHTEAFCRTLCLGDVPERLRQMDPWRRATFDLFCSIPGRTLGKTTSGRRTAVAPEEGA